MVLPVERNEPRPGNAAHVLLYCTANSRSTLEHSLFSTLGFCNKKSLFSCRRHDGARCHLPVLPTVVVGGYVECGNDNVFGLIFETKSRVSVGFGCALLPPFGGR